MRESETPEGADEHTPSISSTTLLQYAQCTHEQSLTQHVSLYVSLSACLTACLSACLTACLTACLSACLTACLTLSAPCHLRPYATLQRAQQDTGNLLPGHGGILDRVDSYMLTAAPVYFFVKFCLPLLAAFV